MLTGASSGIGRQLAIQLAKKGCQLLITARRLDRLASLAKEIQKSDSTSTVAYVAGDVTNESHRIQLLEKVQHHFSGLDILINNAGIGAIGPFDTAAADRLEKIMNVNFRAPVELTRLSLGFLKNSNDGAIVNVGSVLAYCATPTKSEYCASKFALRAFSDSLRIELRKDKIDVLSVHPNTTQSEFFDRLIEKKGKAATNPMAMSPQSVAKAIVHAIEKRRPETVLSWNGKLLVGLATKCPRITRWLLRRF